MSGPTYHNPVYSIHILIYLNEFFKRVSCVASLSVDNMSLQLGNVLILVVTEVLQV